MVLRVFISYSSRDRTFVEEFHTFLTTYELNGEIALWEDHKTQVGDSWSTSIHDAMHDCNVAILLISQEFLASRYITGTEVPKLLERHARGEVVIAPVFLSPSMVHRQPFVVQNVGKTVILSDFHGFRTHGNTPDWTLQDIFDSGKIGDYRRTLQKIADAIPDLVPKIPVAVVSDPYSTGVIKPKPTLVVEVKTDHQYQAHIQTQPKPPENPPGPAVEQPKAQTTTQPQPDNDPYPTNVVTKPTPFVSKTQAIEMVALPGGTFTMGSPGSEKDRRDDEGPIRKVTLNPFAIGVKEITQHQYQTVMGDNPSNYKGDDLPVENLTWYEAVKFCNTLSEKEGLPPAYVIDGTKITLVPGSAGYRLPTEAEWEYAARAGTQTAYFFGDDPKDLTKYAWFDEGPSGSTHPVATKQPSPWGLYDIYGNVFEWCWDWYAEYDPKNLDNPLGPPDGQYRVCRGGSFWYVARYLRSAYRLNWMPDNRNRDQGLRVCRSSRASMSP